MPVARVRERPCLAIAAGPANRQVSSVRYHPYARPPVDQDVLSKMADEQGNESPDDEAQLGIEIKNGETLVALEANWEVKVERRPEEINEAPPDQPAPRRNETENNAALADLEVNGEAKLVRQG